jgi:hypothetical protein
MSSGTGAKVVPAPPIAANAEVIANGTPTTNHATIAPAANASLVPNGVSTTGSIAPSVNDVATKLKDTSLREASIAHDDQLVSGNSCSVDDSDKVPQQTSPTPPRD